MKRTLSGVAVVALIALLLAGCTSSGGSQGSIGGGSSSVGSGGPAVSKPDTATRTVADPASKGTTVISENRDVVTTGTLSLTVDDPLKAADSATATVAAAGGRIDSATEQPASDTQKASATLVLRIPSAKLDSTLASVKQLGTVNSSTISSTDVTTQVQDINARITALQTSVDRLLALMSKATSTADLLAIESTLSDRQGQLDSLTAQQKVLADQVSMSTITLELHANGTVAAASPSTFWSGLLAGWNALVTAGNGLLVALGVALPWLVVLAVIGGVIWLIVRWIGRKRGAAA